ncbi:MAG: glycosyltransferase family 61 protein [Lachnospiraceae bacterium]|nr:glycosyltransferase family 61 protein [Lachnospiraceae bacterium]
MRWLLLMKGFAKLLAVIVKLFLGIYHILRKGLHLPVMGLRRIMHKKREKKKHVVKHDEEEARFIVKVFMLCMLVLHKLYEVIRYKLYWWLYKRKINIYTKLSKNAYLDVFMIFVRDELKGEKNNLQFLQIESVENYIKEKSQKASFQVVEKEKERYVCVPEYFEKSEERIEKFTSEKIYVAQMNDVEVIGASDVVIADGKLLNDAVSQDEENRLDIRYSAIKSVIKKVALIEADGELLTFDEGIYLLGAASYNYYHLVVEILSRLAFVDYYEEYREYPILIDEVVLRIPQFATALGYFNKYNHKIIKIEKNQRCMVKKFVLPSHTVWMPINLYNRNDIRVSDFLISETVLENIRGMVTLYQEKEPWRKVFISRKNTIAPRLRNEEKIRELFAENGFEIIYTEEFTFEQQVECFGQAKCVVASSGAALTNTIFCQPGTVIGCIIPSYHRFYMYSTIAYHLGLKPVFLDAEIIELTPYAASDIFELDEEYAYRYIKKVTNLL